MSSVYKAILCFGLAGMAPLQGVGLPQCLKGLLRRKAPVKNGIGVIKLIGNVDYRPAEEVVKKAMAFSEDAAIKGVLLVIDSGGGGAGASELLLREIKALAVTKPVVALAVGRCCSGGYQAAAGADWIIAPQGSTIGHIGCSFTVEKHKKNRTNRNGYKADVDYEIFSGGKFKTSTYPHSGPLTTEEKAVIQGEIDETYKAFCAMIAQQRKLSLDKVTEWADGKMFSGCQALEKGLIDQIGGYSDAIKKLKELMKERGNPVDGKITFVE
jgi:protease-4